MARRTESHRATSIESDSIPLTRYDAVLAAIPAVFVLSVVLAPVLSIPVRTGIAGASILSAAVLVDALYLNPPRPPRADPATSTAD